MPYIGKAPQQGIRNRYIYQATAGQTTFSGSDANALTLSYPDSEYVDVFRMESCSNLQPTTPLHQVHQSCWSQEHLSMM